MGLFDDVAVECPDCKHTNFLQSKAGPCCMETYTLDNAPIEILRAISGEIEYCTNCRKEFVIRYRTVTRNEAYVSSSSATELTVTGKIDGNLTIKGPSGLLELDEEGALRVVEDILTFIRTNRHVPPM